MGPKQSRRLGLGHRQLRLLGWYWSRGNAYLRDPLPFRQQWRSASTAASDVDFRRHVRVGLPNYSRWPGLVAVLRIPDPQPNVRMAKLPFTAPLGRVRRGIYGTVSILFWYVGLIPDFATLRDRAKTKIRRMAYGVVALGWRGVTVTGSTTRSLTSCSQVSRLLVLSVHSIVSFDFAVSLPGWHTTIFPPYFVAGAIFSGFAMVANLGLSHVGHSAGAHLHCAPPRQYGAHYSSDWFAGRLRLRDGVLYRLVRSKPERVFRLYQPCIWQLCVGVLDHGGAMISPQIF